MIETGHSQPEFVMQQVRDEINAREEKFREDRYEDFLFHAHYDNDKFLHRQDDQLERLRVDFLEDKKRNNMQGRLRMGLSEKYLDKIHVIELGLTTKPGENGEADGLKDEYIALRSMMIAEGLMDAELTRQESGRFLEAAFVDPSYGRVAIGRTRPLVSTLTTILRPDGTEVTVSIDIVKRMVFSIPSGLYEAYAKNDPDLTDEFTLSSIESLLEAKNKLVDPIRTTYYLRTAIVGENTT